MKSVILGLFFLSALTLPAWAGSFSIDFNDHSTQLGIAQKYNTPQYGDSVVKGRFLYNEDTDTKLLGIAAGVIGTPGNVAGLNLGIDVNLNGGSTADDLELLAAGLGLSAEFNPPQLQGFGVDAHLIYSPKIFAFMDVEDYFEWGFGVSYLVLPNARLTLAFQNIEVEIENGGDYEIDDTVRFGIEFEF
jgi:hypothetical protein